MLCPIQLKRHHFTSVVVEINEKCQVKPTEEQYEINVGISDPERQDGDIWKLSLLLIFAEAKEDNPPRYKGRVSVTGYFSVAPDFDPSKVDSLVRLNGGSLLLGAAREMIATITSRSARGLLMIATFDARMFLKPEPAATEDFVEVATGEAKN